MFRAVVLMLSEHSVVGRVHEVPPDPKQVLNQPVYRDDSLALFRRLEPAHVSLSLSRRLLRDSGPVVRVPPRVVDVWDIWFELKRCDPPEWMEVEVRDFGGGETVEVFRHPGPERLDEKEVRISFQSWGGLASPSAREPTVQRQQERFELFSFLIGQIDGDDLPSGKSGRWG